MKAWLQKIALAGFLGGACVGYSQGLKDAKRESGFVAPSKVRAVAAQRKDRPAPNNYHKYLEALDDGNIASAPSQSTGSVATSTGGVSTEGTPASASSNAAENPAAFDSTDEAPELAPDTSASPKSGGDSDENAPDALYDTTRRWKGREDGLLYTVYFEDAARASVGASGAALLLQTAAAEPPTWRRKLVGVTQAAAGYTLGRFVGFWVGSFEKTGRKVASLTPKDDLPLYYEFWFISSVGPLFIILLGLGSGDRVPEKQQDAGARIIARPTPEEVHKYGRGRDRGS